MYDLIIIGGGPAGLTAGIYATRAGLKTLIIEKDAIGGQISSSPKVQNYPGFSEISGMDLANNFFEQAQSLGCEFEIDKVVKVENGKIKKVITTYNEFLGKTVIFATGAKHKLLGIDNEIDLIGKGIHFCASCDGAFYKGEDVAVVGGANSAIASASYLSGICKTVYLLVRKDKLKGEKVLINDIEKNYKNVKILYNTFITKLPEENIDKILVCQNGNEKQLNVKAVFLSIGLTPESEIIENFATLTTEGYVLTNDLKTEENGIFVAGDVVDKDLRQLTTAISDGSRAATLAIEYLKGKK